MTGWNPSIILDYLGTLKHGSTYLVYCLQSWAVADIRTTIEIQASERDYESIVALVSIGLVLVCDSTKQIM